MAKGSILTYLPTGWTEERYKNATDDDWQALPEHVSLTFPIPFLAAIVLTKQTGS
jgi:hypothetical protein